MWNKRFAWTWATQLIQDDARCASPGPCSEPGKGATTLSFYAWGTTGDEVVSSLVGMGPTADGFEQKLEEVKLTTAPKQYTIDVSRVRDRKVVGGFGWVAGGRTTIQWH
ncbi:hypothetical protein ACN28E_54400 [Archangium lansingense]|uniref:hypothetical protein n=1 Tax=Archangium lansingense TaxID=2995310 RepID=UPI003B815261